MSTNGPEGKQVSAPLMVLVTSATNPVKPPRKSLLKCMPFYVSKFRTNKCVTRLVRRSQQEFLTSPEPLSWVCITQYFVCYVLFCEVVFCHFLFVNCILSFFKLRLLNVNYDYWMSITATECQLQLLNVNYGYWMSISYLQTLLHLGILILQFSTTCRNMRYN